MLQSDIQPAKYAVVATSSIKLCLTALMMLFNFKSYTALNKTKTFELWEDRNLKGGDRDIHEGTKMMAFAC
jgi:hypothetical protein